MIHSHEEYTGKQIKMYLSKDDDRGEIFEGRICKYVSPPRNVFIIEPSLSRKVKETRKYARTEVEIPVEATVINPDTGCFSHLEGTLVDLSAGGAKIWFDKLVEVRDRIIFKVNGMGVTAEVVERTHVKAARDALHELDLKFLRYSSDIE